MKKNINYLISLLLGVSLPIYFFIIWEPLKSKDTISNSIEGDIESNYVEESTEKIYLNKNDIIGNLSDELDLEDKEVLKDILYKLSISDLLKINSYFKDENNKEDLEKGFELIKERISILDYKKIEDIMK